MVPIAVAALLVTIAIPAQAAPRDASKLVWEREYAPWRLSYSEKSRSRTPDGMCALTTSDPGHRIGLGLIVVHSRPDVVAIVISDSGWSLPRDAVGTVGVAIDGRVFPMRMGATGRDMLTGLVAGGPAEQGVFLDAFKAGSRMAITMPSGQSHTFSLRATRAATTALSQCVADHLTGQAAQARNPLAPPSGAATSDGIKTQTGSGGSKQ